jgi:catechol 2,3 dioxygenase
LSANDSDSGEPTHDVAHLAHIELLSPRLEASYEYFTKILWLVDTGTQGDSVYLRGVWDYEKYCLKLTAAPAAGVGHVSLRASSPAALDRRVRILEARGLGIGWEEGEYGHGPAYRFRDADNHVFEIYYETERYVAPPELRAPMKNQPQRRLGQGIGVSRLEHVNLLASDVRGCRLTMRDGLGMRVIEQQYSGENEESGVWTTSSVQGHEVIYTKDNLGANGRLHHIAFWVDSREQVLLAADLYQDRGVYIEAGPSRHTVIQSFFLYCYEPGGNRIEVTTGGYLVFDPDPEPVIWSAEEWADRSKRGWGAPLPDTFNTYGTPVLES